MTPHPGVARTLYLAKKDLITRIHTAGPAYYIRVRMEDSRSINGQARTLIIRAFSSGLLVRTHELQGGNLAQVT